MMYFSREPPGPGEERLARILPALTHLTSNNNVDNHNDNDSDGESDGDLSPDSGAGAALHSALDADVDAWAGPDHLLAHLVITLWAVHSTSMILTSAPGLQAKSSASTSCHPWM